MRPGPPAMADGCLMSGVEVLGCGRAQHLCAGEGARKVAVNNNACGQKPGEAASKRTKD